ncbi:hypothetical protein BJY01DRAFT_254694 [Aspergillus pseudoustus]|uniref:Uncharacterized protein n=1 Tax=Aspergillus pseudoustus TaxID=1810923 RepID=A0ABR4IRH8_9EURO
MAETTIPYDASSWGFDPLNPGPGFNLEPGVSGDEELWYRSHLGMNVFDQGQLQPVEEPFTGYDFATPGSGKTASQLTTLHMDAFPSRADKLLPRVENLQAPDGGAPYSLEDLLRAASQLATERALYMNIPQSPQGYAHSPPAPAADAYISSPGASPSHHSNASDTDEPAPAFDFAQVYRLPEGNGNGNITGGNTNTHGYFSPPIHILPRDHAPATVPHNASDNNSNPRTKAHAEGKDTLTPLEMPDGSTRFTANWLPVDPQGGFTIRPPAQHMHFIELDPLMDYDTHFDHGQAHGRNSYNYRDAFISIENNNGAEAGAAAGV